MDARVAAAVAPPAAIEVPEECEFISFVKDFEAKTSVNFGAARQSQLEAASRSIEKRASRNNRRRGVLNSKTKDRTKSKKEKEFEEYDDIECASALLDLSIHKEEEVQGASALLRISSQNS